jgi:hypothetical protein
MCAILCNCILCNCSTFAGHTITKAMFQEKQTWEELAQGRGRTATIARHHLRLQNICKAYGKLDMMHYLEMIVRVTTDHGYDPMPKLQQSSGSSSVT